MKPTGVKLKHKTLTNALFIVENKKIPYGDGGYQCKMCLKHHRFKTTHLWLEPDGTCLVSVGVLEELKRAGFPLELLIVGVTHRPPPLRVGRPSNPGAKVTPQEFRFAVDNDNRRIWLPAGFRHILNTNRSRSN